MSTCPSSAWAPRQEAFAACEKGNAPVCRAKLDEAKTLHPKGEQTPDVMKARARIKEMEQGGAE